MKRFLLWLLLQLITTPIVYAQSFCDDEGECISATLNNQPFQFRDYLPITAFLIRQQESMDGRIPGRTIVSVILSGASYTGTNEKQFTESIQFEIKYEEDKLGEPSLYTVSLQHESGLYSIKGRGGFTITEFVWEPDHRSFRISADINCVMYRWGFPLDGKEDIALKGNLSHVLVTVPGWLASKTN